MVFERAQWIWHKGKYGDNDYAELFETLTYNGGSCVLRLSVCGDYAVFINGKFAEANQFADFPHYKVSRTFWKKERTQYAFSGGISANPV